MNMMTAANRIVARDPHWLQAWRGDKCVATARRKNKGTLWTVWLYEHTAERTGRSRNEAPHARISGKLPEDVQQRLVRALLGAA